MTAKAPDPAPASGLPSELLLAFAPLDKAAFGAALGVAVALLVFLVTVGTIYVPRTDRPYLGLLSVYFRGYSVSWTGALIGAFWGAFMGFVFGWFLAFCRNLMVAISLFVIRSRAELTQTRDFLDHI
jgi:hypothetical protein